MEKALRLLLGCLVFVTFVCSAGESSTCLEYKGSRIDQTLMVCQKFKNSDEKNLCMELSPGLDPKRVESCQRFSEYLVDVRYCLHLSSFDIYLNSKAIDFCAHSNFSSEKRSCLEQFACFKI